ncbi:MAG: hypothetical protein K0S04_1099 [Herbinix sp.]|jgi:hypothetical protein|nr:hypothetical protein [Herbinix sp.]
MFIAYLMHEREKIMKKFKTFATVTMLVGVMSLTACSSKESSDEQSPTTAPTQAATEDATASEDTAASEGTTSDTAGTAEQLDFKGTVTTVVGDAEAVFRLNSDKTYNATCSLGSYGVKDFSNGTWEYADNSFNFTDKDGKQFKSEADAEGQQVISGVWTIGSLTDQEITVSAEKDAVAAFVPTE